MKYRIGVIDSETNQEVDSKKYLSVVELEDNRVVNVYNWRFCDCSDGYFQANMNITYNLYNVELSDSLHFEIISVDEECNCNNDIYDEYFQGE